MLCGCLVTSSNRERVEGNYIGETTLAQVEPGKTTAAWVASVLGTPDEKIKVGQGESEIWKYSYTEHKDSSGAIFLIFGGSNTKQRKHATFVEFKDGVVVNKWRT
jgi:outer membrane protein assembly factor BamE (lipoprotein component of BamABCDE complex)